MIDTQIELIVYIKLSKEMPNNRKDEDEATTFIICHCNLTIVYKMMNCKFI